MSNEQLKDEYPEEGLGTRSCCAGILMAKNAVCLGGFAARMAGMGV